MITDGEGRVVQLVPSAVEGRLSYRPFGDFAGPKDSETFLSLSHRRRIDTRCCT